MQDELGHISVRTTTEEGRAQVLAMTGAIIDGQPIIAAHLIQRRYDQWENPIFWIVEATRAQHEAIARALDLLTAHAEEAGRKLDMGRKGIVALSAAILGHTETAMLTSSPEQLCQQWEYLTTGKAGK